jgi:tetratricopeptide (TPR) repeat protein
MTEKRPTLLIRGLTVRGSRHLAKGRYDQALAHFDRAIELDQPRMNSPLHGLRSVN